MKNNTKQNAFNQLLKDVSIDDSFGDFKSENKQQQLNIEELFISFADENNNPLPHPQFKSHQSSFNYGIIIFRQTETILYYCSRLATSFKELLKIDFKELYCLINSYCNHFVFDFKKLIISEVLPVAI